MTARQQLARLLPLASLILLAIAGLRGDVTAPRWDGPLRSGGVAIGLVLEVILGVLLVITLRRDSAASNNGNTVARVADGTPIDVPAALRFVLKWVLAAGMIAVAVVLIAGLHLRLFTANAKQARPASQPLRPARLPTEQASRAGTFHVPLGPILYGLLVVVLVAAVVISIWWSSRLRRPAAPDTMPDDLAEDSAGLRDAVASGRAALAELDDAREAIVACYVAMERTLADRGTTRRSADTPDELLARAVTSGILRGRAAAVAGELTTLFYEARFSTHPLGQAQRDAARQALDYLAGELSAELSAETAAGTASSEVPS